MNDLRVVAAVGAGAAIGAIARLLVTQLVVARAGAGNGFYATLFINVSGSFLIGVVLELAQARGSSALWRFFLATGVLGGYTTFSTFSFDALTLLTGRMWLTALAYMGGSLALGVAGAWAGIAGARALNH